MAEGRGQTWAGVAVLAALAVLAGGWFLTGVSKSRRADVGMTTQNHLKQIGMGLQNYHDTYLRYPGNGTGVGTGLASPAAAADGSCFYQILPYIEQDALYRDSTLRPPAG